MTAKKRTIDVGAIKRELDESSRCILETAEASAKDIASAASAMARAMARGSRLLICGNGGSAADSQHVATEMVVRFERERRALPALALTTDTSLLTAEANDHGFDTIFSRQVQALGRKGDVLLAISTSGNSPNVLEACRQARRQGMTVIGLTGPGGGAMAKLCAITIKAAASRTCRIQECHLAVEHTICKLVEELAGR